MPADYTMLFKALVTTEGLARQLAPEVNPVELARPFIEELIRQRYGEAPRCHRARAFCRVHGLVSPDQPRCRSAAGR